MKRPALLLPKGVKREPTGVALKAQPESKKAQAERKLPGPKPGKTKGSVVLSFGGSRFDGSKRTKPSVGVRRKKRHDAKAQAKISRRRNRAR